MSHETQPASSDVVRRLTTRTASLRQWVLLAVLLGTIAAVQLLTIKPGHDWGDDFAAYIAHAKNIAEGHGYSDTGYIYNPDEPIGPPRAPPGLPILLAPIYAVRGLDLVAMKVLMVAALVVALAFIALLVERWDSFSSAIAVTAVVGFHPYFLEFKNDVMSDLPFLCFFFLAIWLGQRRLDEQTLRATNGIALGFIWWAAYAIRSAGLVLPIAFIITELVTRRRLQRSTIVALVVTGALVVVQSFLLQSPYDYLARYRFQPEAIPATIHSYTAFLRALVNPGFSSRAAVVTYAAANLLALIGFVLAWAKGIRFPAIVLVVYLAGSLLWPFAEGGRYLIPLIPLYAFYIVVALRSVIERLERWRIPVLAAVVVVTAMIYVGRYQSGPILSRRPGIDSAPAQSLFRFVRDSTPSDAVLIFKKPRALALFTGRRAAIYAPRERASPWQFPDRIGATYIALVDASRLDSTYLARLERERPQALSKVFANGEFTVYHIHD